jgi:hypothetical protein
MNVRLLYWPDDRFLTYPDLLLTQLGATGVFVEDPLELSFPVSNKEETAMRLFQKHGRVAVMPETTTRIQRIISELHS